MSLINEESVTDIIKDLDCVQETQQHSVTIEHSWSIREICELINSKRPGDKIESDQFSYENTNKLSNKQDLNTNCKYCPNCSSSQANSKSKTSPSLLPCSYSLNFELACEYLVNNSVWRLEINKSSNDLNYVSVSALLLGLNSTSNQIDAKILNSIENSNTILVLKLKFFLLNEKLNDVYEKDSIELNIDLKKYLNQFNSRQSNNNEISNNKKTFLIDRFQIDKFCQIKSLLNWLNGLKSDDFCLISEFRLYAKKNDNNSSQHHDSIFETKSRLRSKLNSSFKLPTNNNNIQSSCKTSQSCLILNYKHAWMIKNWRNFLMPGSTSHTFLNDLEISNIFTKNLNDNSTNLTTNKYKNEFGEDLEESSNSLNQTEFESIKFGKFRSKLFNLISTPNKDSSTNDNNNSYKNNREKSCANHDCINNLKLNRNKIDSLLRDVKWKLQLYPNGYSQEYENNLSLFVNFSQLSGELSQFTPSSNKKNLNNTHSTSNLNTAKSIEETFYDSNDDLGLILLIKSPPSTSFNQNDILIDEEDYEREVLDANNYQTMNRKLKKKSNQFETFVKASFQISILDSNGKKVDKCQSEKQLFELFGSWGYKEYMTVKDLIDFKDKYLSNNFTTLNLNCKIVLFYTLTTKAYSSSLIDQSLIITDDKIELKNTAQLLSSSSPSSSSESYENEDLNLELNELKSDEVIVKKQLKNKKSKKLNSIKECNSLTYDLRRLYLKSEMYDLIINAPVKLNDDLDCKEYDFSTLTSNFSNLKEFKVHKLILSIRSDVFQKMFSSVNNIECEPVKVLNINDFDAFTVEIFLNYLYTDILEINFKNFRLNLSTLDADLNLEQKKILSSDNEDLSSDKSSDEELNEAKCIRKELYTHVFIELFKISDKYSVHRLKQICENQLVKLISSETLVELLVLSYLHNSNRLKKKCFNHLADNVANIISQPAWSQLEKNYPGLLAESFRVLYIKKRENN